MKCANCASIKTISTDRLFVFSKGGKRAGASDVFALSSDKMVQIAPFLKRIRATIIVEHLTEGGSIQMVLQSTEDGESWTEGIALGRAVNSNCTYTSPWLTENGQFARGIRIGVIVSNRKDVAPAMAYVSLIIDMHLH